jgi:uncharacterized MnhB-related membrane protein
LRITIPIFLISARELLLALAALIAERMLECAIGRHVYPYISTGVGAAFEASDVAATMVECGRFLTTLLPLYSLNMKEFDTIKTTSQTSQVVRELT